jgi:hypothetical protein
MRVSFTSSGRPARLLAKRTIRSVAVALSYRQLVSMPILVFAALAEGPGVRQAARQGRACR